MTIELALSYLNPGKQTDRHFRYADCRNTHLCILKFIRELLVLYLSYYIKVTSHKHWYGGVTVFFYWDTLENWKAV